MLYLKRKFITIAAVVLTKTYIRLSDVKPLCIYCRLTLLQCKLHENFIRLIRKPFSMTVPYTIPLSFNDIPAVLKNRGLIISRIKLSYIAAATVRTLHLCARLMPICHVITTYNYILRVVPCGTTVDNRMLKVKFQLENVMGFSIYI